MQDLLVQDLTHTAWPFFAEAHRRMAQDTAAWAERELPRLAEHADVDGTCRKIASALGEAGWLEAAVPDEGGPAKFDLRAICLTREILAWYDGLADFAFAMQGLGTAPIALYGSAALKKKYLPPVRAGKNLAAFALTEPDAGSDVAAIAMTAKPDGANHYRLDGTKTWISNGGIAAHYVVFARSGEAPGAKGLSAFVVDADAPGLSVAERLEVIAPHPLARLQFDGCRVPAENRLGAPGEGFKVAMAALDIFRSSVGAAALGFARRAQAEAIARTSQRELFGAPLSDLQLTQAALADNATEIDAAALLVYRAAWTRDQGAARIAREAAMAKMYATEIAQSVIDRAVQLHGGEGVRSGAKVERLYREIRALRIYEGATEVQKLIIARELLKARATLAKAAE